MRKPFCVMLGSLLLAACEGPDPEATFAGRRALTALAPVVSAETGFDQPVYLQHYRFGLDGYSSVAWNGSVYLVVWVDDRPRSMGALPVSRIWGARVDASGKVLDPGGLRIGGAGAFGYDQNQPVVASDGNDFLVVWSDGRGGLYRTRVGSDGTINQPGGAAVGPLTSGAGWVKLASDRTGYLLVWSDYKNSSSNVRAVRLSKDGAPVGNGLDLAATSANEGNPAVTFGGDVYLVLWSRSSNTDFNQPSELEFVRVDRNGVLLDAAPRPIAAGPMRRSLPAATHDGTNFLVVWAAGGYNEGQDVYGTRLSSAGMVLDPAGIAIGTAAHAQSYPAAGYDGTQFVVSWQDGRATNGSGVDDIYAARVTRDGMVRDTGGIALDTDPDRQTYPELACRTTGEGCLVIWDSKVRPRIGNALVRPDGTLDAVGKPLGIATSAAEQGKPEVASDGTAFLVTWREDRLGSAQARAVRVTRPAAQPEPDARPVLTTGGTQYGSPVGFNGVSYQVTWQGYTDQGPRTVGSLIGANGEPLDSAETPLSQPQYGRADPRVVCSRTQCLVAWMEQNKTRAIRVGRDGKPIDTASFLVGPTGALVDPRMASNGEDFFLVWVMYRDQQPGTELLGTRVTAAGAVLDPTPLRLVTGGGLYRDVPNLAWGAGHYLLVWHEAAQANANHEYDISALRIGADGKPLDAQPIRISAGPAKEVAPVVTWTGASHLVVWNQEQPNQRWEIVGRRVTPGGRLRESAPFLITDNPDTIEWEQAIASDGKGTSLVVYDRTDESPRFGNQRVRGRFVVGLLPGAVCTSDAECDSSLCSAGVCCDPAAPGSPCALADEPAPDAGAMPDALVTVDVAADLPPATADRAVDLGVDLAPDAAAPPDASPDRAPDLAASPDTGVDLPPRADATPVPPDLAPAPDATTAPAPDAAATTAPDARAAQTSSARNGCSCALGGVDDRAGGLALILLAGTAVRLRRARRRTG